MVRFTASDPHMSQDPDHMSRSEYRQRQRQQGMSDAHTLDGGEDASTLGFSLGSVQSAPALGGLGLGLSGSRDGGSGGRGGRRAVSGDGNGGGGGWGASGGSRGTSITAFENVNPFAGAVRVDNSSQKGCVGEGGGLSPLSASVGGEGGDRGFSGAGPESSSVGEDPEDPHLALVKVCCLSMTRVFTSAACP